MTAITTSTASTATAYSNQRKVDRCQNGVLWSHFWDGTSTTGTSMDFYYSTDNGATWTKGSEFGFSGTGTTYTPNASLFIDVDDYAHVVYKDRHDGYIFYRRGTPDAGRTSWTWSAAETIQANANDNYPDVVAHREGTGWAAHVIWSRGDGASTNYALYRRVTIASGGSLTLSTLEALSPNHGNGVPTWPSIDFNHTGDGKTVAGSTPHLYAAWSAGATGAGKGIRFKKATYSAGSWTWGTEREIDSTRYVNDVSRWLNCLFDGTRVVFPGWLYDGAGVDLVLHEQDAADTTTTTRVLFDNAATADSMIYGSTSYDDNGNVFFVGRAGANLVHRKWTRSTASIGATTTIDSTDISGPYVSAKRGYSANRIEFIYTDGDASPYNVTYGGFSLAATVKWWDGAAWTAKPLKRWTGTEWSTVEASKFKYWNGTSWTVV